MSKANSFRLIFLYRRGKQPLTFYLERLEGSPFVYIASAERSCSRFQDGADVKNLQPLDQVDVKSSYFLDVIEPRFLPLLIR